MALALGWGGRQVRNLLTTCLVYCGPFFLTFCFNNTVAWIYQVLCPHRAHPLSPTMQALMLRPQLGPPARPPQWPVRSTARHV